MKWHLDNHGKSLKQLQTHTVTVGTAAVLHGENDIKESTLCCGMECMTCSVICVKWKIGEVGAGACLLPLFKNGLSEECMNTIPNLQK